MSCLGRDGFFGSAYRSSAALASPTPTPAIAVAAAAPTSPVMNERLPIALGCSCIAMLLFRAVSGQAAVPARHDRDPIVERSIDERPLKPAWTYTRATARLSQASNRVGPMRGLAPLGLR